MVPVRFPCSIDFRRTIYVLLMLLACTAAKAVPVTLNTDVLGEAREATTDSRTVDGEEYLSLTSITNQFGGAYSILPNRIRIDLMGSTAWLGINDNRVNALSIFSLAKPVVRLDDDVWIAQNDVQEFFTKSFRLDVQIAETLSMDSLVEPDTDLPDSDTPLPDTPASIETPAITHPIRTIIIDPGHGGYDPGLEGLAGGIEKVITLNIATRLTTLLKQRLDIPVFLTRTEDIDTSMRQRYEAGVASSADLLISIHAAGSYSANVNGFALFYSAESTEVSLNPVDNVSQYYAKIIAHNLGQETQSVLRGIHPITHALFQPPPTAGVLIEVGHLTNPSEEAMLNTAEYQQKIAQGIATGLIDIVSRQQAVAPSPFSPSTFENQAPFNE